MDSSNITAIDLGSNSYRVLKYDCIQNKTVAEFETTVGLADGLSKTQKISDEAVFRVLNAIHKSIETLQFDPTKAVAVTTHAMRKALNSYKVIQKLQEQTGVLFQIIDGDTEAKLTLLAMKHALKREKIKADKFFLLDIGGGSTELIYCQGDKEVVKSFSYGIVTLSQSYDKQQELQKFQVELELFLESLDKTDVIFISTAGTPTTLAALKNGLNYKTYDKTIVNGTRLDKEEVIKRKEYLQALSKEQLIKEVGSGRDDYIDAGISIYLLFFEVLGIRESIVFDDGLREGVAINSCTKILSL
jgi:exopolyphosphatase / guanosine-5'-triphosphate,3'-diphosphate pyrophosphatase